METKEKTITYGINKIREVGFNYQEPIELLRIHQKDIDSFFKHINYALNVNYFWDINHNSFAVILDFHYGYLNEGKITELLHFKNITEFIVRELKDIFTDKGNGLFDMDKSWEITFVSLAISSGRGMLASRTAGTVFGTLCFPLLNPEDYIVSKRISKSENSNNNKK